MSGHYTDLTRIIRAALLAVVVIAFLGLGTIEAYRDAPTYDEPVYISSALAALQRSDLAVNAEHPPLFKVLAALPVLAAKPILGPSRPGTDGEYPYGRRFVERQVANGKLKQVTFLSRLVPLLFTVLVALLLYRLAARLWGESRSGIGAWAGLLAAVLWLAQPLVLGLGHLDGVDVPFALAVILYCDALLSFRRDPQRRRTWVVLGVCAGISVLANDNGLLLVPLATVLGWLQTRNRRALAIVVGCALVTIWLPYALLGSLTARQFLSGVIYLFHHDTGATQSYLLGTAWNGGEVWYFPLSLLVKLAPGTLALLLAAPVGWWHAQRDRREVAIVLGLPALLLILLDLSINRDIGVRYALPVVAITCALAGGLVPAVGGLAAGGARRLAGAVIAILLASAAAMTALSFPDSLAWVDPVFGQPYRVATNSSVDWGQDWYALQRWSAEHPEGHEDYFGPEGLTVKRQLEGPVSGWLAVSASNLTTGDALSWLRAYCPVEVIDDTLVIYRFAETPSGTPGPAEPAAPCRGARFSRRRVRRA